MLKNERVVSLRKVTRFHSRFERVVDMQSIINDALKNAELEKEINKPGSANAMEDDFVGQP